MSVLRHKNIGPLVKTNVNRAFERLLAAEHWSIRMEKSASHSSLKKHSASNYLHFSVKIDQLFFFPLENLFTGVPVIQRANMEASVDFHKANTDRAKPEVKEDLDQWFLVAMRASASSGLAAVSLR